MSQINDGFKRAADLLYLHGLSVRTISEFLRTSPSTLARWRRADKTLRRATRAASCGMASGMLQRRLHDRFNEVLQSGPPAMELIGHASELLDAIDALRDLTRRHRNSGSALPAFWAYAEKTFSEHVRQNVRCVIEEHLRFDLPHVAGTLLKLETFGGSGWPWTPNHKRPQDGEKVNGIVCAQTAEK